MKRFLACATIAAAATLATTAGAHDIEQELAAFAKAYATKDPSTSEARAAKLLVERAQAYFQYSDSAQLLRIRSLTNNGLKAAGEQPAFLASEIKRLEAAVASPKTNDPEKIAQAKKFLEQAKAEKAAYDVLDASVADNFKESMKLLNTAK
jgi:DNA-binding GntR family transcriptional regulator